MQDSDFFQELFGQIESYSPDIYRLMQIAFHLISDEGKLHQEFSRLNPKKTDLKDENLVTNSSVDTDDFSIENFRKITEFHELLKKQFMLPDELFNQKLISRNLLIKKKRAQEKRQSWDDYIRTQSKLSSQKSLRRQCVYILMDRSKSTERHYRLLLEKAIVLAYLHSAKKYKGEIYFRAFHHDVSPLSHARNKTQYIDLINRHILPVMAEGQTYIQRAILQAISDIENHSVNERAEILLITDGLSDINLEECLKTEKKIVFNIIKIGDDDLLLSKKELEEMVSAEHASELDSLRRQNSAEAKKDAQQMIESYASQTENLQEAFKTVMKSKLERLAIESGGQFLEIMDQDKRIFSMDELARFISKEMEKIQEIIENRSLTPLQREQAILQYFALKNYLNDILKTSSFKGKNAKDFQNLSNEMNAFIKDKKIIMELVKASDIRISLRQSLSDKSIEISLFELFRILFDKLKSLLFSRN